MLQKELKDLWLRRRDVVKALAAAAAEGDRSENAEYIYRKKELGGLDYRIRYLQKRLPTLNIVRDLPNGAAVYFGATVRSTRRSGRFKYLPNRWAGRDKRKNSCNQHGFPFGQGPAQEAGRRRSPGNHRRKNRNFDHYWRSTTKNISKFNLNPSPQRTRLQPQILCPAAIFFTAPMRRSEKSEPVTGNSRKNTLE